MKNETRYALNQASKHLFKLSKLGDEQAKKDFELIEKVLKRDFDKRHKKFIKDGVNVEDLSHYEP